MEYLNRHLVTVYGKQAFLDWIIEKQPHLHKWNLELLNDDPGAYLIEIEDQNCHGESLKDDYIHIFKAELSNVLSESEWPKNLTYKLFYEWFAIKYHTYIADLAINEVSKST